MLPAEVCLIIFTNFIYNALWKEIIRSRGFLDIIYDKVFLPKLKGKKKLCADFKTR